MRCVGLLVGAVVFTLSGSGKVFSNALETDHFYIQYDTAGVNRIALQTDADGNGHPDFVDSMAVMAQEAWTILVDTLGYPAPVPFAHPSGKYVITVLDVYNADTTLGGSFGFCS